MNHPEGWQRAAIAYHEAGHAVVRCVLGFGPKSAKIIPKHDAGDVAQYANPLRGIKLDTDGSSGRALLRLMKAIQISYAGPLAQRKYSEHSWREFHGICDFKKIEELSLRACGSSAQVGAFKHWLEIATQEMIDSHWSSIQHVAKLLLGHDHLSGTGILAVLRRSAHSTGGVFGGK
jgi:hypothetical protein